MLEENVMRKLGENNEWKFKFTETKKCLEYYVISTDFNDLLAIHHM